MCHTDPSLFFFSLFLFFFSNAPAFLSLFLKGSINEVDLLVFPVSVYRSVPDTFILLTVIECWGADRFFFYWFNIKRV